MSSENSNAPLVLLKGQKNGITVQLDKSAAFDLLQNALRRKVADAREFFAGANTSVSFKGRTLSEDEEKKLLDIIFSETTLDVSFVTNEDFTPNISSPVTVEKIAEEPEPPKEENEEQTKAKEEYSTMFYRRSLRSGQSIRYNGSVVVLGDVNAGGEIVASGNIIVLGTLRGMVHAGSGGDSSCFVSALSLTPTQLRIASIITSIPQEKEKRSKTRLPEYAYIQDGQVFIVRH